jgi:hypothetical protein
VRRDEAIKKDEHYITCSSGLSRPHDQGITEVKEAIAAMDLTIVPKNERNGIEEGM